MTENTSNNIVEENAPAGGGSHELRGIICSFLGAACWGFSATCVSYLVGHHDVDVTWLACVRLFAAGLLFLAIAVVRERDKFKLILHDWGLIRELIAYTLFAVILMQISYMTGIKYTDAGTTLLLLEVSVPMVLVVECIRGRRLPRRIECLAIILAAAGVVCIATQGNLGSIGINPLGLFWGLMSAVANASYILIPRRFIHECGSLILNGVAMFLGSLVLMPFARPWESPATLDATGWLVFAGIVLVGTVFAYAIYLRGVKEAGAVKASLIGVVEPVSGALISAIWLGTVFSSWDFAGGVFIITMMIIVSLKKDA